MKKLIAVLALALLIGGAGPVFADDFSAIKCPTDQKLRKIGNVFTADTTVVTDSGHDVRMIVVTCTTTACRSTIYDGDSIASEAIDANVTFEAGTIASAGQAYYFDTPLFFDDGIIVHDDGNVTSVQLYECR